ncbi:hypothetical protein DMC30DRAFT_171147 [Rhodotorula diobovata]|uniref:Proteophosphoglycan ppg4 n=1 Tax=Rhodotorula diobovata TaxID=5288 RepID=A0A5C5G148_9BASI|nr:hypothetical protein DMC30DRAFT_171147 [Rhodotorula diobovata]
MRGPPHQQPASPVRRSNWDEWSGHFADGGSATTRGARSWIATTQGSRRHRALSLFFSSSPLPALSLSLRSFAVCGPIDENEGMSGVFGGTIPPGTEWIGDKFADILQMVKRGASPYSFIQHIVFLLYHPTVPVGFSTQLWCLFGLFVFSAVLILVGLSIRVASGRFWLFARVDGTLLLPNAATLMGLCTLVYQGLGLLIIVLSVDVSHGADQRPYYQGLRRAWFAAIRLGVYMELWSCLCSWYIRARGAYYKPSVAKRVIAVVLPFFLILVAWVPPAVIFTRASQDYNSSFRISKDIDATLERWQESFKPGDGLDISKLATLFVPGAELGRFLTNAATDARIGYAYVAGVLIVTFLLYVVAISLEVSHLAATISQLRARARQVAFARSPGRRAADKPPLATASSSGPLRAHVLAQLEADQQERDGAPLPWALLAWVRRNRLCTAACIATMLLVNAALDLWQAVTPLDLAYPSGQFQVETLVSCWLNGLLSTLVSLLLLFRSLDATSSPLLSFLRTHLPFLPFPPSVSLSPASRSIITSEPPRFAAAYGAGGVMPLVERSAIHTLPAHGHGHGDGDDDLDRALGREFDDGARGMDSPDSVPVALSEASTWGDDEGKVVEAEMGGQGGQGWTRGRGSGSTRRESGAA